MASVSSRAWTISPKSYTRQRTNGNEFRGDKEDIVNKRPEDLHLGIALELPTTLLGEKLASWAAEHLVR